MNLNFASIWESKYLGTVDLSVLDSLQISRKLCIKISSTSGRLLLLTVDIRRVDRTSNLDDVLSALNIIPGLCPMSAENRQRTPCPQAYSRQFLHYLAL